MRPPLGDVVARARGLATHLLDPPTLLRLARAAGPGALASALEDEGYWPAPSPGTAPLSAARVVDGAIEHGTLQRLALLGRWLAERARLFAAVFDLEVRDALRVRVRELAAGVREPAPAATSRSGWPALRELVNASARAPDLPHLVRALRRLGSAYAEPLAAALRGEGEPAAAAEAALDRAWAERARRGAARAGEPVRRWVAEEIDLHNAWGALAGGGAFLDGGARLPPPRAESIAGVAEEAERRRQLARAFRDGPLSGVFADPDLPLVGLEARARRARIEALRRASRLDPIGAGPILEVLVRLRSERADLRRISWGVATGLAPDAITAGLVAAP